MEKSKILAAIQDALAAKVEALRAAADETRKGAVHEESRAENDKDTRGLEASYLARGQAARVVETLENKERLKFLSVKQLGPDDSIQLSALVELTSEKTGETRLLFLVPVGGGLRVEVEQNSIQLITPVSPLGRSLVECQRGDLVSIRNEEFEITNVT